MFHKKFEKLAVLSAYDELSADEKEILGKHLLTCARCRRFSEQVMKMKSPDENAFRAEDTNSTLANARSELHGSLAARARNTSWRRERPLSVSSPGLALGFAAVTVFMLGAGSSYFYFGREKGTVPRGLSDVAEVASGETRDATIGDVRFISTDQKTGELQFSVDVIRHYDLKGSLSNRDVQQVMAYALVNSDNPGTRIKTIGMLTTSTPKPDVDVRNALLRAVKTDDNAGVRRQALLSLGKMPFDTEIREALLYVLQHDKNPGMRVAAINLLSEKEPTSASASQGGVRVDLKVLNVLKERMNSDQNKYVRMKAADMLKDYREL